MPPATVADIGLTRKAIHDARQVRNAEVAEPGIVQRPKRKNPPSLAARSSGCAFFYAQCIFRLS